MPTSTPPPLLPVGTASPAPTSHLMNLPTELRLQIFSHILPESNSSPPKFHPHILATCRKCCNEAEPLLYDSMSFHLEDDPLSTDYRIRSPLTHGEEERLGRRFWEVVQFFQEILPVLRKFRHLEIILPVLRGWRVEDDVAVPIDGLLYVLGSLLEGSEVRSLRFVQEVDEETAATVKQAEDFDWSAPFLGPSVTITCSGFTLSTTSKMQSLAAKPQNILTNVLLPWINLKRQVQGLFVLLEKAKMRCPVQGLLIKHMVEGDNGCARLEVLSLSKRKVGEPHPLDKGFPASRVQTALERPLAKLTTILDEEMRELKDAATKKLDEERSLG